MNNFRFLASIPHAIGRLFVKDNHEPFRGRPACAPRYDALRGMKADLVMRVHDAFEKAAHAPDVVESLAKLGVEPAPIGSPAQFAAMVAADSQRWVRIIRERKITLE